MQSNTDYENETSRAASNFSFCKVSIILFTLSYRFNPRTCTIPSRPANLAPSSVDIPNRSVRLKLQFCLVLNFQINTILQILIHPTSEHDTKKRAFLHIPIS